MALNHWIPFTPFGLSVSLLIWMSGSSPGSQKMSDDPIHAGISISAVQLGISSSRVCTVIIRAQQHGPGWFRSHCHLFQQECCKLGGFAVRSTNIWSLWPLARGWCPPVCQIHGEGLKTYSRGSGSFTIKWLSGSTRISSSQKFFLVAGHGVPVSGVC